MPVSWVNDHRFLTHSSAIAAGSQNHTSKERIKPDMLPGRFPQAGTVPHNATHIRKHVTAAVVATMCRSFCKKTYFEKFLHEKMNGVHMMCAAFAHPRNFDNSI